jgi:hypothetical protein
MKIRRRTEEHAQFFGLMEKPKPTAKPKPKGIKDMGWVNGCWQAIAVNHQKDTVTVMSTPRHTFGVSLADAFANANMEVLP